jgi:hypothetical protein
MPRHDGTGVSQVVVEGVISLHSLEQKEDSDAFENQMLPNWVLPYRSFPALKHIDLMEYTYVG